MEKGLVSVCIPAYNAAAFIGEAIQSVLDQTYENFEIVIIDDCSTDGTADAVRKFDDSRIRFWVNEQNLGATENWNRVVHAARGEYLKVLCDDDVLHRNCLARQVAILDDPTYVGVSLVACQRTLVDDRDAVLKKRRGLAGISGRVDGRVAIRKCIRSGTNIFGEPVAVMMRTELLKQCLPWSGSYMVDVDMWVKLLQRGDLYAINEPLCNFRISSGSWSRELASQQKELAVEFFREVHKRIPDVVSTSDVRVGWVRASLLERTRRAVYFWLEHGRLNRATKRVAPIKFDEFNAESAN